MNDIRIASLNVNGARDCRKRAQIYEVANQNKIDVLFLQETHSDVEIAVEWAKEWGGLLFLSHNTSLSGGVAVLFNKNFAPSSCSVEEIVKGRLLKIKAHFEDHVFVFICVYAPTSQIGRMLFLDQLNTVIEQCDNEVFLVVGGDFNCVERNIDRNHVEPHMASRRKLIEMIEENELGDVWRNFNRDVKQYTWTHVCENVLSMARLDRFYVFKHHLSFFVNSSILPVGFSDHSLVVCRMIAIGLLN